MLNSCGSHVCCLFSSLLFCEHWLSSGSSGEDIEVGDMGDSGIEVVCDVTRDPPSGPVTPSGIVTGELVVAVVVGLWGCGVLKVPEEKDVERSFVLGSFGIFWFTTTLKDCWKLAEHCPGEGFVFVLVCGSVSVIVFVEGAVREPIKLGEFPVVILGGARAKKSSGSFCE